MKLTLIPVAPIGTHTSFGHIAHAHQPHEWGPLTIDDYPASPRADELTRLRLDHATLQRRDVARALGLSFPDYSALENGRATLSDEDWQAALAAVRALATAEGR